MQLKRHKDFLNESQSPEYYGYIGIDLAKDLKFGDQIIQHSTWPKGEPLDTGEVDKMLQTVLSVDERGFTTVDGIGFSEEDLRAMNDDTSEMYEKYEDDIKETYFEKVGKDEHGIFFIDIYTGSKLYYMYNDDARNKKVFKDAARYNVMENIYDDKLTGKATDLSYLLKQLKELIDKNDSYKANVRKDGDKIVIEHEIPEKKQHMIIKDNGKENDFFFISGTDDKGNSIDDMGEQPAEVIFVQIAKLFQEI